MITRKYNKQYKLTWKKDQGGRWCKKYRLRAYTFRRLPEETKDESYQRCWNLWLKKKIEIDEQIKDKPHKIIQAALMIDEPIPCSCQIVCECTNPEWWGVGEDDDDDDYVPLWVCAKCGWDKDPSSECENCWENPGETTPRELKDFIDWCDPETRTTRPKHMV